MWIFAFAMSAVAGDGQATPPVPAGLTGVLDEPVTLTTAMVSAVGERVGIFLYDVPIASCDAFAGENAPRPRAVVHDVTWKPGSWDLGDHLVKGGHPFFLLYGKDRVEVPKAAAGEPPPKAHLDILAAPTDYGAAGHIRLSIERDAAHHIEGTVAATVCSVP